MKRLLCLILLLVGLASSQTTSVTGTITYSDSQVLAGANITATFVPSSTAGVPANQYRLNGSPFTQTVTATSNGSGTFAMTLSDDHIITPAGGLWSFTVCVPVNTKCFTSVQDVNGSSLSLSAPLSAVADSLYGGVPLSIPSYYADSEVSPSVGMYYNYTTNTYRCYIAGWTSCSGGGGNVSDDGSEATGDVAFWSGPLTIGGNVGFNWSSANGLTLGDDSSGAQAQLRFNISGKGVHDILAPNPGAGQDQTFIPPSSVVGAGPFTLCETSLGCPPNGTSTGSVIFSDSAEFDSQVLDENSNPAAVNYVPVGQIDGGFIWTPLGVGGTGCVQVESSGGLACVNGGSFTESTNGQVTINAPTVGVALAVGNHTNQLSASFSSGISVGSGVLTAAVISNGTTFTSSGCSATSLTGGATKGSFHAGATSCTIVITMGGSNSSTNGWACSVWDTTTTADTLKQTAFSTTTATFSGTVVSGDVIIFSCDGF